MGVEKLDQEINTTIKGGGPGVPGLADGKLKINDNVVNYQWTDGSRGGFFRRLFFEVFDPKFALQSFCRALAIKEKELKGDNSPEPNAKVCATCGEDISKQETTYTSEGSNYCSQECLEKGKNKDKDNKPSNNNSGSQNENNPEKKGMSTGLKVFLGISATILVLIVIIFIGTRGYKNTSKRERERERDEK